jgi:hypothetical protein
LLERLVGHVSEAHPVVWSPSRGVVDASETI